MPDDSWAMFETGLNSMTTSERLESFDFGVFDDRPALFERCGILPMHGVMPIEIPNVHPDPRHFFRITRDYLQVMDINESDIWAFVHTHVFPDSYLPSSHDLAGIPKGRLGVVYHVVTRSVVLYEHGAILHVIKRRRPRPSRS